MKRLSTILLIALVSISNASAQDVPAAVQFQQAHDMLNQGDLKRDSNQLNEAISLYSEAQTMYSSLAHKYPDWQKNVVKFRAAYCADQIESMLTRLSSSSSKKSTAPRASSAQPSENDTKNDVANARKLLKAGQHVKARILLLRAVNSDPDNPTTRLLLAVAQCQAGKYNDAIYILDSLISDDPADFHALTVQGAAYFALGDMDKAKSSTEKALKINPDSKEANFNLAQILVDSNPPDKELAKRYYKAALSLGAIRNATLEISLK